ncbi:hypothetical protein RHA66_28445 [Pseudomonas aeruginosa]|nr:hypothetical protein [Pseudomonas aeruginosa]MDR9475681.1 hypothetical protein [Pseudomonas aeruginosa]
MQAVTDSALVAERHAHISGWIERADGRGVLDPSVKTQAETIIVQVLESFDAAVKKLRALRP